MILKCFEYQCSTNLEILNYHVLKWSSPELKVPCYVKINHILWNRPLAGIYYSCLNKFCMYCSNITKKNEQSFLKTVFPILHFSYKHRQSVYFILKIMIFLNIHIRRNCTGRGICDRLESYSVVEGKYKRSHGLVCSQIFSRCHN